MDKCKKMTRRQTIVKYEKALSRVNSLFDELMDADSTPDNLRRLKKCRLVMERLEGSLDGLYGIDEWD